jgi:hypothetical protein
MRELKHTWETHAMRKAGTAIIAGGSLAALYFGGLRDAQMHWGASADEAEGRLSGDELMPAAAAVSTRAIEIKAPPSAIWPWLVQMGPGRAGAYSYDWIERRLGIPIENTDRIIPELQHLEVGDEMPMPGYAMRAEIVEQERTLAFRSSDGRWVWSFHLRATDGHTRLISRNRFDTSDYRLKDWLGYAVMEPGSWVMERKMLRTIKQNAEELARAPGAR